MVAKTAIHYKVSAARGVLPQSNYALEIISASTNTYRAKRGLHVLGDFHNVSDAYYAIVQDITHLGARGLCITQL